MSIISCFFEALQIEAHFLSIYLDQALLEKRYVTYLDRVSIRDLSARIEGIARALISIGPSIYPSGHAIPIRNRVHFLQSQLQVCIKRNVFTSLYGTGKTITAVQRVIEGLQVLDAMLESPPPKDPSERPEIDLADARAETLEYFRFGFLEKRGSSSPRAMGSYFEIGAFPLCTIE